MIYLPIYIKLFYWHRENGMGSEVNNANMHRDGAYRGMYLYVTRPQRDK